MNPELLETVDFFNGLSVSDLNLISPYFSTQTYPYGLWIFEQDASAEFIYLVCEGAVEIIFKPDDGPPMKITTIYPGGIFGWSAALGNVSYTSGALCREDCKTLKMRGRDLHVITQKYPDLGNLLVNRLAEVISERWHDRQSQITKLLNKVIFDRRSQCMDQRR